jgi:Winged helix-turn helix
LRRLAGFVRAQFTRRCGRESIRRVLHRLNLSWKKARKLLGRAQPKQREAFMAQIGPLLDGARDERHHLVYLDEAHIHQDVDLGYGCRATCKTHPEATSGTQPPLASRGETGCLTR